MWQQAILDPIFCFLSRLGVNHFLGTAFRLAQEANWEGQKQTVCNLAHGQSFSRRPVGPWDEQLIPQIPYSTRKYHPRPDFFLYHILNKCDGDGLHDTGHILIPPLRAILHPPRQARWVHFRGLCTISELRTNIVSKYDLKREAKKAPNMQYRCQQHPFEH